MQDLKNGTYVSRGFTLIEVVLAVAISVSIIFAVASFRSNLDSLNMFLNSELQSRQDIDPTLQLMARELRSAGPSSLGSYPIEAAGTSTLIFYSDIDRDGIFERVRYSLGTSTIQKGVVEPTGNPLVYTTSTEVIADVITGVVITATTTPFMYYNTAYTGTQDPMTYPIDVSSIRLVNFSVSVSATSSPSANPEFFTQTMDVRNLRSN